MTRKTEDSIFKMAAHPDRYSEVARGILLINTENKIKAYRHIKRLLRKLEKDWQITGRLQRQLYTCNELEEYYRLKLGIALVLPLDIEHFPELIKYKPGASAACEAWFAGRDYRIRIKVISNILKDLQGKSMDVPAEVTNYWNTGEFA